VSLLPEGEVDGRLAYRTNAYKAACSKYKIPDHQNGQVYLTSHRICYVDNEDPRKNSTAVDLKDVDRYEFYVCQGICN
jgi:hypothetical protein